MGMPRIGKTTLGRLLAKKLSIPFYDVDEQIQKRYENNFSTRQIFKLIGVDAFRKEEFETLKEISEKNQKGVVSLGGGIVDYEDSRKFIKKIAINIYLSISLDAFLKKIENDKPLSLTGINISEKYLERHAAYEQLSHFTIPIDDLTPKKIMEKVRINEE